MGCCATKHDNQPTTAINLDGEFKGDETGVSKVSRSGDGLERQSLVVNTSSETPVDGGLLSPSSQSVSTPCTSAFATASLASGSVNPLMTKSSHTNMPKLDTETAPHEKNWSLPATPSLNAPHLAHIIEDVQLNFPSKSSGEKSNKTFLLPGSESNSDTESDVQSVEEWAPNSSSHHESEDEGASAPNSTTQSLLIHSHDSSDLSDAEDVGNWFDEETGSDQLGFVGGGSGVSLNHPSSDQRSSSTVSGGALTKNSSFLSHASKHSSAKTISFEELHPEWADIAPLKQAFDHVGLSESQQTAFLKAFEPCTYAPGDYIVQQGEMGDAFFAVTYGEVEIKENTSDGGERSLAHLYKGACFGELSLLKEEPRVASVQAVTDVTCLRLRKNDFSGFSKSDDKFEQVFHTMAADKMKTRAAREKVSAGANAVRIVDVGDTSVKVSVVYSSGLDANGNQYINEYTVLKKLGQGSFGKVFLVKHLHSERLYAMKVIDKKMLRRKRIGISDEELLREVAVMKQLKHPNLVNLQEVIDSHQGDCLFLVQEYMEYGPIMTESEYNQPLNPEVARQYLRDILRGMEYLHAQRIIHRDLKPSNILISGDGRARICDFGVATVAESNSTRIQDVAGTPAFMAPELFSENADGYDGAAVDIWALGATLYTLVVGRPPFMAENEFELVRLVQTQPLRFPSDVLVDAHLQNLLQRMLCKSPTKRSTLEQVMKHEWVTREGAEPLPRTHYVKSSASALETDSSAFSLAVSDTSSQQCTPLPSDAECSPLASHPTGLSKSTTKKRGTRRRRWSATITSRDELAAVSQELQLEPQSSGSVSRVTPPSSPAVNSSLSSSCSTLKPAQASSSANSLQMRRILRNEASFKVEHLRQLRKRQHALLQSHKKTISGNIIENLLDQGRVPIHALHTTVSVENVWLPAASPKHSHKVQQLRKLKDIRASSESPSNAFDAGTQSPACPVNTEGSMSSLFDSNSQQQTKSDSPASLFGAEIGARASSYTDSGEDTDQETSHASTGAISTHNSERGVIDEAPRGGLKRVEDFVMVTESMTTGEDGGKVKKAVIFRSSESRGSLSIASLDSRLKRMDDRGKHALGTRLRPSQFSPSSADRFSVVSEGQESAESSDSDFDGEIEEVTENLNDVIDGLEVANKEDDEELAELPNNAMLLVNGKPVLRCVATGTGLQSAELAIRCGMSETVGERSSMEDRMVCIMDLLLHIQALEDDGAEYGLNVSELKEASCRTLAALQSPWAYIGVFDGHGGDVVAEYLKRYLHLFIMAEPLTERDLCEGINAACLRADKALCDFCLSNSVYSGATALACTVYASETEKLFVCASVGDCRCVLSRAGVAIELSEDHRADNPAEMERVRSTGAWVHNGRVHGVLAVSRSFGDIEHKSIKEKCWEHSYVGDPVIAVPDITTEEVSELDEFAICACDGLWDVLSSQEAVNFVRRTLFNTRNVQTTADALVKKAVQLCSADNISVAIVCLNQMKETFSDAI